MTGQRYNARLGGYGAVAMTRDIEHSSAPSREGTAAPIRLNLGSGDHTPEGWTHVDYALGARFAKLPLFSWINRRLKMFNIDWDTKIQLHDLTTRFPWTDSSVDHIYSSHTLEHFSRSDGRHFLSECHRVLKPGGIIRIVVPDLRLLVDRYLEGEIRADSFVDEMAVGYDCESDGFLKQRIAPLMRFPHKCMYDSESLLALMSELGFRVSSKKAFESDISDIESVERSGRAGGAVIVEGTRP
jgi:SAM-dependent methyltransferase